MHVNQIFIEYAFLQLFACKYKGNNTDAQKLICVQNHCLIRLRRLYVLLIDISKLTMLNFQTYCRFYCFFNISEGILLIYVFTFLPQNFKLSLQVMQDDAITSNEVKHFSLEKIYFPRK